MSGKGDRYRSVNVKAYKANHDRIFKKADVGNANALLDIEPAAESFNAIRETLDKKRAETTGRCPHTVDIEVLISESDKAGGGD